jgi:hypothetical protein
MFKLLIGTWKARRTITNKNTIYGTATFTKIDDITIKYREDVIFDNMPMYKEYIYKYISKDSIKVYFMDGRHFHTFKDDGISIHHCLNDTYRIKHKFHSKDKLEITYLVNGPEKSYISNTVYTRLINI